MTTSFGVCHRIVLERAVLTEQLSGQIAKKLMIAAKPFVLSGNR
jgi:hypothetical protein